MHVRFSTAGKHQGARPAGCSSHIPVTSLLPSRMPGHLGVEIHTCPPVPRALHVKSACGQRGIVPCDDAHLLIHIGRVSHIVATPKCPEWSSLQGSPFHLLSVQVHAVQAVQGYASAAKPHRANKTDPTTHDLSSQGLFQVASQAQCTTP